MKKNRWIGMTAAALVLAGSALAGEANAIGTVSSRSDMIVNARGVAGSGTLKEGSEIKTPQSATVRLNGGSRIELGAKSEGRVHTDHFVLEAGSLDVRPASAYRVEAGAVLVETGALSATSVAVDASRRVIVQSRTGTARVLNPEGVLLARVLPGRALVFDTRSAEKKRMALTGIVRKEGAEYSLTDSTAGVTVKLQGAAFDPFVNQAVNVCGTGVQEGGLLTMKVEAIVETKDAKEGSINCEKAAAAAVVKTTGKETAKAGAKEGTRAAILLGTQIGTASLGVVSAVSASNNSNSSNNSGGSSVGPQTISQ
jgi:hypothetical protein